MILVPVLMSCGGSSSESSITNDTVGSSGGSVITSTTSATGATTTPTEPVPPATTQVSPTVAPPSTAGAGNATAVEVSILDFAFGPSEIEVPVGGSVSWTNGDDQPHTATASGSFDSGAIEAGASGTVVFPEAGTFAYVCSFHPFMKGSVVVG